MTPEEVRVIVQEELARLLASALSELDFSDWPLIGDIADMITDALE